MIEDRRLHQLRRGVDNARSRVRYYRAEIARLDRDADPADVMFDRPRAKLAEDLRKAEADASWAEIALADATSPGGGLTMVLRRMGLGLNGRRPRPKPPPED